MVDCQIIANCSLGRYDFLESDEHRANESTFYFDHNYYNDLVKMSHLVPILNLNCSDQIRLSVKFKLTLQPASDNVILNLIVLIAEKIDIQMWPWLTAQPSTPNQNHFLHYKL